MVYCRGVMCDVCVLFLYRRATPLRGPGAPNGWVGVRRAMREPLGAPCVQPRWRARGWACRQRLGRHEHQRRAERF